MKRLTLILSLISLIPGTVCHSEPFNPQDIAASFGVVSDVHIERPDGQECRKFKSALEQLQKAAQTEDPAGLKGVLVAGDLVNNPFSSEANYVQMYYFKTIYESVFSPLEVPMVYTPGNHDTYKWWTPDTPDQAKHMSSWLGEDYFKTDIDPEALQSMECRHCVIGGYHILCIVPVGLSPVRYTPESVQWLDEQLKAVTEADPRRYVIVLTHPMIYNTVYGSLLGSYWATEGLTQVLSKYPQAVTFSGHLHFPLNDPRSVWQGDFTSFGCGSTRYMAIEEGHYERMRAKTVMKDADEFSQGLLLQFDSEGNLRATRMDFYHGATIGEPWEIPAPAADLSHLLPYNHDRRAAANKAPVLGSLKLSSDVRTRDGLPVSATFARGEDDEFVHHYRLTVSCADTVVCVKNILADFYRTPNAAKMQKAWTEQLGKFKQAGEYKVSLVAFDSWGAQSGALEQSFSVPGKDVMIEAPVEHQWMYYGDKPCKLNVNLSGTKGTRTELQIALVRDLSLMSGQKDTVVYLTRKVTVGAKPSKVSFNLGKLEPGFYQVRLGFDGITDYKFNIGVNPEKILSPQDKKPDFDEFWSRTLEELAAVDMEAKFTVDKEHSNELRTTYTVTLKSLGGETMGGILCMPNKPGKYETFIDYMGYGAQVVWYDPSAAPERVEFLVSVRDQGIFKRKDHYRWIDRGLGSRETFYYRGAFCDVVRAIDFVCSLGCVDPEHLYARGESQGGAFTLVSVSLDHRIKACAPAVPFLNDFRDYSRIVRWPMWEVFAQCEKEGIDRERLLDMLTYFDIKNFADRIQCPVYMSFGLQDGTCPPHTNFAGYNLITAPKHYWCAPELGHEQWDEKAWHESRQEWFESLKEKK